MRQTGSPTAAFTLNVNDPIDKPSSDENQNETNHDLHKTQENDLDPRGWTARQCLWPAQWYSFGESSKSNNSCSSLRE